VPLRTPGELLLSGLAREFVLVPGNLNPRGRGVMCRTGVKEGRMEERGLLVCHRVP